LIDKGLGTPSRVCSRVCHSNELTKLSISHTLLLHFILKSCTIRFKDNQGKQEKKGEGKRKDAQEKERKNTPIMIETRNKDTNTETTQEDTKRKRENERKDTSYTRLKFE